VNTEEKEIENPSGSGSAAQLWQVLRAAAAMAALALNRGCNGVRPVMAKIDDGETTKLDRSSCSARRWADGHSKSLHGRASDFALMVALTGERSDTY